MNDRPAMSHLRRTFRLMRKEVATILRDRRTIITLVLMPILLYPLLSVVFHQFLAAGAKPGEKQEIRYNIGLGDDVEVRAFERQLLLGQQVIQGRSDAETPLSPADPGPRKDVKVFTGAVEDLEGALARGEIHLGVRVRPPVRNGQDLAHWCDLYYLENSATGLEVKEYVERRLAAANDEQLFARMGTAPPNHRSIVVMAPRSAAVKDPEASGKSPLPALLPLILILMTITGAVYPAIDLTAGERERGTLEILVAAPVPRMSLLFAKYVSVVTVAFLTATVNLVMMTATLLVSPLGASLSKTLSLTPGTILQVFLLMLLFAMFFSAVLLTVTSFARSFKEGQAYLIPLMLVSLAPGVMGLLPWMKLEGTTMVVPLLNIVLLTRDILNNDASLGVGIVVVLSTLVYAVAAIALAARVFGAEAVLYSEQGNWGDLFRRPREPSPAASLSSALFCLAIMFPLSFAAVGLMRPLMSGRLSTELAVKAAFTVLLFALLPLLLARMRRVEVPSGFRLTSAGVRGWGPAVLLGVSLWVLTSVLIVWMSPSLVLTPEHRAALAGQMLRWRELPPWIGMPALAALTGILEELFFRGYLFAALSRVTSARTTILTSAVFFGLFHLIDQHAVSLQKGAISFLLGLLLGWVAWRTGSVMPGMILHALHNASLMLLAYYQPELVERGWFSADDKHLPWQWLAGATAVALVAVAWLWLATRGRLAANPRNGYEPPA